MSISGIQSGQEVYGNLFAQGNSETAECSKDHCQSSTVRNPPSDTVQISGTARELALQKQEAMRARHMTTRSQPAAAATDKVLPMEAYSIPGWMGDFGLKYNLADTTIGMRYVDSNAYKYDQLSSHEKAEVNEYSSTLAKFYREEEKSRGIETREDYYNAIILDQRPGLSEEMRQAIQQRLAENPRMLELMHKYSAQLVHPEKIIS